MNHTKCAAAPQQEMFAELTKEEKRTWGLPLDAPLGLGRPSFVLDSAKAIVYGPRQEQYGHASVNFQRIADSWAPLFGLPVSRGTVGLALIQLKVMRAVNQLQVGASYEEMRDTYVDIAGYAEASMRAMFEEAP